MGEHPPLRPHEIATIIDVRLGYPVSHHTVKRIVAAEPSVATVRRFPPYHQIADPAERRLALIRLHSEGWTVTAIAAYLQVHRDTVYATLHRWIDEGVAGLDDKSRAPKQRVRKVTLTMMERVRALQANPELGEFRVHAALKQLGIELSPRTCGRILALNRRLYGLPTPSKTPRDAKVMPFAAIRRHQYWTVDLRYLDMHQLGGGNIYVISVLENYSRAILASGVSRTQDASAYLIVLHAALHQHGAPEAIVSDGGGIFRAKQVLTIYEALGIQREQIERRQAWQSYIETAFSIQHRMADWHFARATTWLELVAAHDQWVTDYNAQEHWAHRARAGNRRSPAEALARMRGAGIDPAVLHRVFCSTRSGRTIDRWGYARFRSWRIYGEQGLTGRRVAVWLYAEHLTIEYDDEVVAQYTVTHEPDGRRLRTIEEPRLFETVFRSPQLALWALSDAEWRKAIPLTAPIRRHRRLPCEAIQPPLFA